MSKQRSALVVLFVIGLLAPVMLVGCADCDDATARSTITDWFFTPDQQGQWFEKRGRYAEAAQHFRDPLRQGVAWYRAGEFKQAAAAFAQVDSPKGWFDRGNALVMTGKYDDAITSYDHALALKADLTEAEENRAIALARKQALAPPDNAQEEAAGLDPDAIVIGNKKQPQGQDTTVEGDQGQMSDAELRALWLRRVQTTPQDFLRAKFLSQASQQPAEPMP